MSTSRLNDRRIASTQEKNDDLPVPPKAGANREKNGPTGGLEAAKIGGGALTGDFGWFDLTEISWGLKSEDSILQTRALSHHAELSIGADDFAGSIATTGAIGVGGSQAGNIETTDDADWFRITLTAGETYQFDLQGSSTRQGTLFDPVLQIRDGAGSLITFNDNGGPGYDALISGFTPATSGTYYLSAGSAIFGATGTYRITANRISASPEGDDFAGSSATTGAVGVGGSQTGNIEAADDTDWFSVTLTAGETYNFDLEGETTSQGTLPNPILYLFDSMGNSISFDDDGGEGANSQINGFTATSSGTYYLSVSSSTLGGTGSYSVSATQHTSGPPVVDDYAGSISTTGAIGVGGSQAGNIETTDDADWFRITLTAGETYQFDLQGSSTRQGTLFDPVLQIRDSAGSLVNFNNDGGPGYDALIQFTPATSGTYYLSAGSSIFGAIGSYRITATQTSGPPVLTGLSASVTFAENLVNATPQLLDDDIVLTGSDGDYVGGFLTLTGLLAEDTVSVRNQGSGAGQVGLSGSNVTFGGATIGTLTGGSGATLTITFNAAATSDAIDALVQNLTYANVSNTPTASRDLVLNITDAAGNDLGPVDAPTFNERTGAANPFNGIDVGFFSSPTFADLDGDGDLDATIGWSGSPFFTVAYLENTGTSTAPIYTQLTGAANPFNGFDLGGISSPSFADLDGDGDLDVVVGNRYGLLGYLENTGTALAPVFTQRTGAANPFNGVDVGDLSTPTFADMDGDGDLDALIGELSDLFGSLNYFENTGTALAPAFTQRTGTANPFNGIDPGDETTPTFADLDGDGDFDVVVGADQGVLFFLENIGTASAPGFTQRIGTANPFNGIDAGNRNERIAPSLADLDGDGDLDLVIGEPYGTLLFFEDIAVRGRTITVSVTAENDAPSAIGLPTDVTITEDVASDLDLSAITLTDPDTVGAITVILTASAGTVSASSGGGVTVTNSGNSVLTLSGTASAIDAFLNTASNIQYTGALNAYGDNAATVTVMANDGSGAVTLGVVNIDITAVDDPMGLTDFGPLITFDENAVNGAPQLLDDDVVFTGGEDFNGGFLTLSGLLAEDLVSVRSEGSGAGQIGLTPPNITFGGVVIGTLAGGEGATLTITFNAAATPAAIDALIQNLTYANVSDTPTTSRDLVLNVTDAAGNDLGAAGPPVFIGRTGGANPFNGVDVGVVSAPTLADLDGDGDLDALVGEFDGVMNYFENTGTALAPVFTQRTGAANPFNGVDLGSNSCPTFADLDGDSDLDVVVGEFDGVMNYFENTGTASVPVFTARTGGANPFNGVDVGVVSAPAFVDLDRDGDLDAVIGEQEGRLLYFENTGTAFTPVFTQRTGGTNPFNGADVGNVSAPTFADLDGDGDFDALVGENLSLNYFENTGTASAPVFTRRTGTDNPFIGVVSDVSTPALADLDGDGDLDAVIGERYGRLLILENTTVRGQAIAVTVTADDDPMSLTGFGPSVTFAENTVNATLQLLDADVGFTDSDGDYDGGFLTLSGLLAEDRVSVRNEGSGAGQIGLAGTGVTFGGVVIGTLAGGSGAPLTVSFNAAATSDAIDALIQNLTYANSSDTPTASRDLLLNVTDAAGNDLGATGVPSFTERAGAANPFNGVDVGFDSTPTFVDLDGDGDLDLVVGESDSSLNYFENTGTVAAPVFTQRTGAASPFNGVDISNPNSPYVTAFQSTVSFADLDGDGDLDALIGEDNGTLNYFENIGTVGAPVFTDRTANSYFFQVDVGFDSTPAFADLDGDGNLDLVVGDEYGFLHYFENTGSAQAPVFIHRTGAANPFNGIRLLGGQSAPALVDLDGDGDLDAVVGEYYGNLFYFENTGTAIVPVFTHRTGAANPFNGFEVGRYSTPAFTDLDGDGDLDAVVGERDGTLNYFENTTAHGQRIRVTVTAENDAQVLTGLTTSLTFGENLINATPQLLDADVAFTDHDGDYDGGFLTLGGLLAEDRVSVHNEGVGAGRIGLSGADVTFGGVVIGTLKGGVGATLTITFNAAATSEAIDALIQNLTYANVSDTPTATRTLVINVTDAAGNDLTGAATPPVQRYGTDNPLNGIDVGQRSAPIWIDLDRDGDLDVVAGGQDGALRYYENTGDGFTQRTGADNPFNDLFAVSNTVPTFVDLDGDSDLDAVLGGANGKLRTLINDGSRFVPLPGRDNPFDLVDVGNNSRPTFADLDGDGDMDAIVGAQDGRLFYFANTGTGFVERTGSENPFDGLDVGSESAPAFLDLDADGDLDALVGGADGQFRYFELTDVGFTERTGADNPFAGIAVAGNSSASFGDLDGDGDIDVLLGSSDGTIGFVEFNTGRAPSIRVTVVAEEDGLVLFGGEGDDTLSGADLDDILSGAGGNDILNGGDGDDILDGGAGNDALNGGNGVDTASYASATAGVTVQLARTTDQNTLGSGRDTLSGIENLTGSAFRDYFTGDAGNNVLSDTLGGNDRFIGGAGNDTLSIERSGNGAATDVTLTGGIGDDTMTFDGNGRYIDTVVFEGQDGNDVISALGAFKANVNGGAGNDTVTVDTLGGSFVVKLGSGSDTLILADTDGGFGGSAANLVRDFVAGAGGDIIDLTAWLAGGALTNYTPGSNPFLDGHMRLVQAGADTLVQVDRDGGSNGFVTVLTLQKTFASNFTAFNFNGLAPLPAPVEGGAGADSLTGTSAIDVLNGNGGNDTLVGLAGADVLNGGAGNDVLDGGDGDDVLNGGSGGLGDTATYATASAGVNVNLAVLGLQNTVGSGFDSLTGIEHLVGSSFTDELRGDGFANQLTDTLGGDDFLRGEAGNDTLLITRSGGGAATTVRLNGGADNDALTFTGNGRFSDTVTLEGDTGDDVITVSGALTIGIDAGAGNDTVIYDTLGGVHRMTLGDGIDTVRLAGTGGLFQASADNLVRDFTTGAGGDIVDLSAYIAGGALTNYTGGDNPFGDGHMRLVQNGTRTLLQVDRDGGGNGYQTILAFANTTVANFTAANFNGIDPTGGAPIPVLAADKDAENGPQVWVLADSDKALSPEVLPGAEDETDDGFPDVGPLIGVSGGGSDPWMPLTLDEAGDGFLTGPGPLGLDEAGPRVLPGQPADHWPEPGELFAFARSGRSDLFDRISGENGEPFPGAAPRDLGHDGWVF